MLSKHSQQEEGRADWKEDFDLLLLAYRTAVHETTSKTPFSLVYGVEARLPQDLDLLSEEADPDPLQRRLEVRCAEQRDPPTCSQSHPIFYTVLSFLVLRTSSRSLWRTAHFVSQLMMIIIFGMASFLCVLLFTSRDK